MYMGKSARRFLWRYLAEREDGDDPDAPLFLGKFYPPFNRDALRQLINSLGKSGCQEVSILRHTVRDILLAILRETS